MYTVKFRTLVQIITGDILVLLIKDVIKATKQMAYIEIEAYNMPLNISSKEQIATYPIFINTGPMVSYKMFKKV